MNGSNLIVEGNREITNLEYDVIKNCYRISNWDLPKFLNHQETDYATDGLFSKIEKSWFNVEFIGLEVEH